MQRALQPRFIYNKCGLARFLGMTMPRQGLQQLSWTPRWHLVAPAEAARPTQAGGGATPSRPLRSPRPDGEPNPKDNLRFPRGPASSQRSPDRPFSARGVRGQSVPGSPSARPREGDSVSGGHDPSAPRPELSVLPQGRLGLSSPASSARAVGVPGEGREPRSPLR